jgi:hypothetical protein
MVDLHKSEAQARDSVLHNPGLALSDEIIGDTKALGNHSIDDGSSQPLQHLGFPGANDVWASRYLDAPPPVRMEPMATHPWRNPTYRHKGGHTIATYMNGTQIDEYYSMKGHIKTVHKADGSWYRSESDWQHGTASYEQHDDSGVVRNLETQLKSYESLRDGHGKLVYTVRKDKTTGNITLIERGPHGQLVTKHYRLA